MRIYIRIKFSRIDIFNVRIGGPGLGNLLFIWSRAVILSEISGFVMLSPNWRTVKFGTFIRAEKDKRTYTSLFKNQGVTGLSKYWLQLCSTDVFRSRLMKKILNVPEVRIIEYEGEEMGDIINYWGLIKERLEGIISDDVNTLIEKNYVDAIGVHIRCGDFQVADESLLRSGKTNTRIPIKWYVRQIDKLKSRFGEDTIFRIYSDGSPEQLREVLSLPNVSLVEGGNALSDLINLSQSRAIIASNSTFSLWASYLGRCHTIWFPGTQRQKLFFEKEELIEIELDYEDELPLQFEICR